MSTSTSTYLLAGIPVPVDISVSTPAAVPAAVPAGSKKPKIIIEVEIPQYQAIVRDEDKGQDEDEDEDTDDDDYKKKREEIRKGKKRMIEEVEDEEQEQEEDNSIFPKIPDFDAIKRRGTRQPKIQLDQGIFYESFNYYFFKVFYYKLLNFYRN
jgi:hypothetical protein